MDKHPLDYVIPRCMNVLVTKSKRIDEQDLLRKWDKATDSSNHFLTSELLLIEITGLAPLQGQSTKQMVYSHWELSINKCIKVYLSLQDDIPPRRKDKSEKVLI